MVQIELGDIGTADIDELLYVQLKIPLEKFHDTFKAELEEIPSACRALINSAISTKKVFKTKSWKEQLIQFFGLIQEKEKLEEKKRLEDSRIIMAQNIKRTLLEFGTKFARLQVAEIAESCQITDEAVIIATIQDMITKHQIDAKYFASTKSVAFNQQANLASRDAFIADLEAEFATWGKKGQAGKTG